MTLLDPSDDLPLTTVNLAPDVHKAMTSAFEDLMERAQRHNVKVEPQQEEQPKSWFQDPFALLDSVGMGYKAAPSTLTYDTLRAVSERDVIIAAIIATRVNQVAAFCRPQENKYAMGFAVRKRGSRDSKLSDRDKAQIDFLTYFLLNTGRDFNVGRDSFEQFMRKLVRDRLTYDQATFEKVHTNSGRLCAFDVVAADTVRIAAPHVSKGTPPRLADIKTRLKYVQMVNGSIVAEFTQDEMAFMVANPRTHIRTNGYGFPEIEVLINTITSHLWAEEWNRRSFQQGSTIKGIINLKGRVPQQHVESFRRQWVHQTSSVQNAWKTPILNTEGVEWMPMQMTNVEMGYQMWMEYLIKCASAVFQIDPAEVNFDLRGGSMQQPVFMSSNEAQQKVSKDRGLHPLLRFIEDHINKHIVWSIDPQFEFAFVGLDAKTEEQAMQLRMQQVQNIYTLNEVRAMEDKDPIEGGDVVLNPTFTGALMQQKMMEQQQQGGQPGQPGGQPGKPAQADEQEKPYFDQEEHGKEEREAGRQIKHMGAKFNAFADDDNGSTGGEHSPFQGGYEETMKSLTHDILDIG